MESQRLIDSFNKNSVEIIKIHLQDWKSQTYIDMRAWVLPNPAEPGAEQATKKGLTLNIELLPRLIKGLQKAQKSLEKRPERPQEGRSIEG